MADEASIDLIARWRTGDQQAASELFHRYAAQLIALASGRSACQSLLACASGKPPAPPQLVNREVLEHPGFQAKLERWRRSRAGRD